jgi:hypothetical protein
MCISSSVIDESDIQFYLLEKAACRPEVSV